MFLSYKMVINPLTHKVLFLNKLVVKKFQIFNKYIKYSFNLRFKRFMQIKKENYVYYPKKQSNKNLRIYNKLIMNYIQNHYIYTNFKLFKIRKFKNNKEVSH